MDRRQEGASTRPRWGLAATWLLGISAVLATLVATVGRAVEARSRSPAPAPAEAPLLLAPPGPADTVRRTDAHRVDTFPEILSAGDAVEIEEGWVVLDPRARRVHVVADGRGTPIRSFGREGEGPGELRLPSRVAVSGAQIGVLEARGDRLVRFRRDGAVLGPVSLRHAACGFGPPRALLAAPDGGFLALRSCSGLEGGSRALLMAVDPEGRVRVVVDRPLQSVRTDPVDPFATPVVTVLEDAAYMGLLSERCLARLDPEGPPGGPASVCVPDGPGPPLPEALRARLEALALRMERVGATLDIPDELPPFTDVRTSSAGPVLVVPLPGGREALDLVDAGGRRVRLDVDSARSTFLGRRHVLLARDLAAGTELAWVARYE